MRPPISSPRDEVRAQLERAQAALNDAGVQLGGHQYPETWESIKVAYEAVEKAMRRVEEISASRELLVREMDRLRAGRR